MSAEGDNGKLSHGPTSDEGKARSSKNALTHGLSSKCVVMSFESQEKYDQHFKEYMDEFQPQTKSEFDLVLLIVNASWRLRRTWTYETGLLDSEMFTQHDALTDAWTTVTPGIQLADTHAAVLATNPATLDIVQRYEARFERSYYRALEKLQQIRRQRGLAPVGNIELRRPEPTPQAAPVPDPEPDPQAPHLATLHQWLLAILAFLQTIFTPVPFATTDLPATYTWFSEFTPTPRRPKWEQN